MALECEIMPSDFWDMTIREVLDVIKAYNSRIKNEMQFKAMVSYSQTVLIVNGIKSMFSKDRYNMPQLHELYPNLFDAPPKKEVQQDENVMKARLLAYAEALKKKNKK